MPTFEIPVRVTMDALAVVDTEDVDAAKRRAEAMPLRRLDVLDENREIFDPDET